MARWRRFAANERTRGRIHRLIADIIDGTGPVTLERMRRMGKTITSSHDLQKKVGAQRRFNWR